MDKPVSTNLLELCSEGGCSAKLPARELENLLADLDWNPSPKVLVGLETGDDAGVYLLNEKEGLILTTDFFPPFCADPVLYGEVAAVNALSDIYAMGGEALAALNITMFPTDEAQRPLLRKILEGGTQAAKRAGIPIIGGHTIANTSPVYGLALLGRINPKHLITNASLRIGDLLILTQPLGTGIAMAAERLHIAPADTYTQAARWMRMLNNKVVPIMHEFQVHAATDITGFSLMGHAHKMANSSNVSIRIWGNKLPVLPHIPELLEMGCIPGAVFSNRSSFGEFIKLSPSLPRWLQSLVFDPQTSGGILFAIQRSHAATALAQLKTAGYTEAAIVGEVVEQLPHTVNVALDN